MLKNSSTVSGLTEKNSSFTVTQTPSWHLPIQKVPLRSTLSPSLFSPIRYCRFSDNLAGAFDMARTTDTYFDFQHIFLSLSNRIFSLSIIIHDVYPRHEKFALVCIALSELRGRHYRHPLLNITFFRTAFFTVQIEIFVRSAYVAAKPKHQICARHVRRSVAYGACDQSMT